MPLPFAEMAIPVDIHFQVGDQRTALRFDGRAAAQSLLDDEQLRPWLKEKVSAPRTPLPKHFFLPTARDPKGRSDLFHFEHGS
jgi:hypothetical protein